MQNARRSILTHRRAVFEAMPGTSADQPDVGVVRVAVDQEIAIGRVLVLADPRFEERGVPQRGKALPEEIARGGERIGGRCAIRGVGIDGRAMAVEGDFHATAFQIGKSVGSARVAEIDPNRHGRGRETLVAGGWAEEEGLLSRGCDAFAKQIGKELGEPWATSVHIRVRGYVGARRAGRLAQKRDALAHGILYHRRNGAAGYQGSAFRLE